MSKNKYWAEQIADRVVREFPDLENYTCAAGISPSGDIHIGNCRELATIEPVYRILKKRGLKARLYLSWDDFDPLRRVPADIPEEFSEHLRKPYVDIPDPFGEYNSYAERFEKRLESSLDHMGLTIDYKYQAQEYRAGSYDEAIFECLEKRRQIGELLARNMTQGMTEEQLENYYPITIYSRFTGKDTTEILSYNGEQRVKYLCKETGKEDEVDLTIDRVAKLKWKIDWPMRWRHEKVCFEPGGKDHSAPGSSFDVGTQLVKEVLGWKAPVYQGYEFFGIRGLTGKMSGSKGNTVSPALLLKVYEPTLLRWLLFRVRPMATFDFAFDSEIIRQYDEFDREVKRYRSGKLKDAQKQALEIAVPEDGHFEELAQSPLPFRQAVGYGQVVNFNTDKLLKLLEGIGVVHDIKSVSERCYRAKSWLEEFNRDELISLLDKPHTDYAAELNEERRERIIELIAFLKADELGIKEIEEKVYAIPKDLSLSMDENKPRQRAFFKDIYNLLIAKDTGPRLPTFLWAADRERVLALLEAVI